jgi:hypothetical protein
LEHQTGEIEIRSPNNELLVSGMIETHGSVASNPQVALQNTVIASLFRHYVDFLAPWYDLNDSHHLFGTTVPVRALSNAILFKALIAFAACHQNRVLGNLAGMGAIYHASCVKDLLAEIVNIHSELLGDYLAATCLLRSYEILNGMQGVHLLMLLSYV